MANMVYANPFGAAVEGSRMGIEDALRLGQGARQMRAEDQNYDFMKWYDPYRRNAAQAETAAAVDKAAQQRIHDQAQLSGYIGHQGLLDQTIQQYYGTQAAPAGVRTPQQSQFAADILGGYVPGAFAYPDINQAGGERRTLPGEIPAVNPLEQQARDAQLHYIVDQYSNLSNPANHQPKTPTMNEVLGLPHTPITPTSTPTPKVTTPSIWHDEYPPLEDVDVGGVTP